MSHRSRAEPYVEGDLSEIVRIARSWPTHFTEEAVAAIENDARRYECLVVRRSDAVVSFIVWLTTSIEVEMLWLATDPASQRRGLARSLVEAVEATVTTQRIITVKTAGRDGELADKRFDASAFGPVYEFYINMGYELVGELRSFWDEENHAAILAKRLWKNWK